MVAGPVAGEAYAGKNGYPRVADAAIGDCQSGTSSPVASPMICPTSVAGSSKFCRPATSESTHRRQHALGRTRPMPMILSPAKTLDFESPLPTRRRSTPAFSKQSAEVTEDHFAKAVGQGAPKGGQKEGQQPAVLPRRGSQPELAAHEKPPVLQEFAAGCEVVHTGRVEDRGPEPGVFPRGNRPITGQGGSESGSVGDENAPTNPTLVSLIEAWPTLPPDTQRAILAIVEAAQGR